MQPLSSIDSFSLQELGQSVVFDQASLLTILGLQSCVVVDDPAVSILAIGCDLMQRHRYDTIQYAVAAILAQSSSRCCRRRDAVDVGNTLVQLSRWSDKNSRRYGRSSATQYSRNNNMVHMVLLFCLALTFSCLARSWFESMGQNKLIKDTRSVSTFRVGVMAY